MVAMEAGATAMEAGAAPAAEPAVVVALTNGQILFIDIRNGQTVKTITPDSNFSFQGPASLAVHGNTLALGLLNGEIRIYQC